MSKNNVKKEEKSKIQVDDRYEEVIKSGKISKLLPFSFYFEGKEYIIDSNPTKEARTLFNKLLADPCQTQ